MPDPVLIAVVVGALALVGALLFGLHRRGVIGAKALHTLEEDARADRAAHQRESAQEVGSAPRAEAAPKAALRFLSGLARSRDALARGLARVLGGQVDDEALAGLEEALIASDLGVKTAMAVVDEVRRAGAEDDLKALVRRALLARLGERAQLPALRDDGPLAILVVGVNGSGKTTTIGKLAARYARAGNRVVLAAGDTYRAGAIEQLKVWGERSGAVVVAQDEGSDPAAVVFDGLKAAIARRADVVICDTAGRLQADKPLMDQLGKVARVMEKALPGAPHEVLLVLDATIGQNALSQARIFGEVVGVTGVALTKLDGTARGGVVVAVADQMGFPVKLVGLGEQVDDLADFDPEAFVDALLG